MRLSQTLLLVLALSAPLGAQGTEQPDSVFIRANYSKHEYRIPMRDGVKLYTIVYTPKDASANVPYPVVMQRTCYSVAPYGPEAYPAALGPDRFMMRDKYIFVYQDVRGRYMSEGEFVNVRPFVPESIKARNPKAIDRIMVQVQSSWFPAFDRNPQTFVPNIYKATAKDFRKATERVWIGADAASGLEVQVLQ